MVRVTAPVGKYRATRMLVFAFGGLTATMVTATAIAAPPPIRITEQNRVPTCVTPDRLMAFLRERNLKLDSHLGDIARWYKTHGEHWRVRWDYAFFQMIIETNHLMFRTGSGKPGDVSSKQNNFAGIGTTGGGVPGDGYPDVSTGVLAQIQHLVAYSGERLDKPVAPRTQLRQDDIIFISKRLNRPVTFGDLAGRWAVDRRYARSIESVAERFRASQCSGQETIAEQTTPAPQPAVLPPRKKDNRRGGPAMPLEAATLAPVEPTGPKLVREPTPLVFSQRANLGAGNVVAPAAVDPARPTTPTGCRVQTASYVGRGGATKALLIRAMIDGEQRFTALQVLDGFERSMADSFISARAPGGVTLASFDTSDAALAKAYELCPAAR